MSHGRLVPRPGGPRLLRGWLERHQHPFSFYLHLAGIPMTLVAVPLLFRHRWRRAAGLFGGGYTLQFLGGQPAWRGRRPAAPPRPPPPRRRLTP